MTARVHPTPQRPFRIILHAQGTLNESLLDALGMTLPYSSSIPAEDPLKMDECRMAGKAMMNLLELDLKPKDIM
eukprot:3544253-Pyramimonas_sp.AAC.2